MTWTCTMGFWPFTWRCVTYCCCCRAWWPPSVHPCTCTADTKIPAKSRIWATGTRPQYILNRILANSDTTRSLLRFHHKNMNLSKCLVILQDILGILSGSQKSTDNMRRLTNVTNLTSCILHFFAILWAVRADFLSALDCLGMSFFQPWVV